MLLARSATGVNVVLDVLEARFVYHFFNALIANFDLLRHILVEISSLLQDPLALWIHILLHLNIDGAKVKFLLPLRLLDLIVLLNLDVV